MADDILQHLICLFQRNDVSYISLDTEHCHTRHLQSQTDRQTDGTGHISAKVHPPSLVTSCLGALHVYHTIRRAIRVIRMLWQLLLTSCQWHRDLIGLCSVLRPRQHSIGYMGDGFYRWKDPTNSIKVLKEMLQRKKQRTKTTKSHI